MLEHVAEQRGRLRRHSLSHRSALHFPIARRLAVPHVTTLHGRLDLADLDALLPRVPAICRWCRSPMRSGRPCAEASWIATVPSRASAGAAQVSSRARRAISRFSAASRPRSASIARSRSPWPAAAAADRRQGRPRRSRLLRARDPAAARSSAGRVRRRDRRRAEETRSSAAPGAALPDRLARAVRPGDDRGAGVRHAGRRVPRRVGPRGDRARRDRLHRRHARRGDRRDARGSGGSTAGSCRAAFERRFTASRMAADYVQRLSPRDRRRTIAADRRRESALMAGCDRASTSSSRSSATPNARRPAPRAQARRHLRRVRSRTATSCRRRQANRASITTARGSSRGSSCCSASAGRCSSARRSATTTRCSPPISPTPTSCTTTSSVAAARRRCTCSHARAVGRRLLSSGSGSPNHGRDAHRRADDAALRRRLRRRLRGARHAARTARRAPARASRTATSSLRYRRPRRRRAPHRDRVGARRPRVGRWRASCSRCTSSPHGSRTIDDGDRVRDRAMRPRRAPSTTTTCRRAQARRREQAGREAVLVVSSSDELQPLDASVRRPTCR